jgi:hypothetical protein
MKKILLAALIIIAANVQAQAPQGIAFQAIARNLNGSPIANRSLQVRFSVLDSAANVTAVYVETHSTTTNTLGLFSLSVGMGTPVTNTFTGINWGKNNKFLKTEIDADGTGNWLDLGTQQMMSVPYALYAGSVSSTNINKHFIGENYGGGIIFHLYTDSLGEEHGLIVTPKNAGSAEWSNVDTAAVGINAQSTWDGKTNTQAIILQPGHIYSAAYLCDTLTMNGKTDWYLPAEDELVLLYNNRYLVNKAISKSTNYPQIIGDQYVSSTELTPSAGVVLNLMQGISQMGYAGNKTGAYSVRAIRSF